MSALKTLGALAAVSFFPLAQAWYQPLPPCISEYQPFVQAGCFDNGRDGAKPALTERMDMDIYNMTTEKCVDTCKGNGFRYAGLAYIGVCYCGQTVDKPMVDNSQCHMPCSGNGSETCGGDAAINIYQDPTFLPVGETTVDEYVALGCHTDNVNGGKAVFYRQEQLDDSAMTTKTCLNSCLAGGFPFAGTEFGGECYCGVVLGNGTEKVDDARCRTSCTGAPGEVCGGPDLINIYVAKDLQSLEPCGYEPPLSSSVPTTSTTSTRAAPSTSSGKTTKTKTTTTTTETKTTETKTTEATKTKTTKTLPPATTVTEVPVPTGTGICKQPSNKLCGYKPGQPLGGIALPPLTCNNLAADFHAGNVLKLYTDKDSARCPSFPKHQSPAACVSACLAQFDKCLAVYVPGVKSKAYGRGELEAGEAEKRAGLPLGLDWVQAKACCSLQLLECKAANLKPVADGCNKFGDFS